MQVLFKQRTTLAIVNLRKSHFIQIVTFHVSLRYGKCRKVRSASYKAK